MLFRSDQGYLFQVHAGSRAAALQVEPLIQTNRIRFSTGSLVPLPFSDQFTPVVFCFRLLPHFEAWPELIAELCRVAGELVIVDYPNSKSINAFSPFFFRAKKSYEQNTRPFVLFNHHEVESSFRTHGFVIEKRFNQFFLPMVLHRVLQRPALSRTFEYLAHILCLRRYFGSPTILCMRRS